MHISSPEALLCSIREPAAIVDHEGRIHAVNAPWSRLNVEQALAGERFGVGGDYLARCAEVRGGESVEAFARGTREVLAGRSQAFTLEYACDRAAPPRHFEVVASALASSARGSERGGDEASGALIMHYDITERQALAAAHQDSEERLNYVLEMLPEGYWDYNIVTNEVMYSERWCESLGYAPGELAPHVDSWVNLLHPDDVQRVMDAAFGYIEGRYPAYDCETRLRMKNGKYRWNIDRGRIVARDADGKPLRMVGMEIDITERKQAELVIEEQSKRLRDLSTPLIPITDRVVVMPLIGLVDAQRAEQVLSTLLEGLSRTQASVAILDVTGVSLIDSHVASVLVNAAKAVQLLGAQVVLTGLRPDVAKTLVRLDIPWGNIVMRGTLQAGIAYATRGEQAAPRPEGGTGT
ncbi:PAS domain-containing protein [Sorangium sp. So ce131]|uniref:PAS domain-containing protein n=1 Tax=Sorangium sp. So ce131 TaxID=3133282 RepID=UPI003F6336CB